MFAEIHNGIVVYRSEFAKWCDQFFWVHGGWWKLTLGVLIVLALIYFSDKIKTKYDWWRFHRRNKNKDI